MQFAGAAVSNRTAGILLVLLTLVAGAAARAVDTLHPRSLLPWVCLSAIAVAWTFRRPRAVDLFEPFTFLSWIHYAPAYVVGAFLLAIGVVDYPYAALVPDPIAACALALVYLVIGYFAFGLGSSSRATESGGNRLASLLPAPPAERTIPFSAILLLVTMGLVASYGAFRSGIIGYAIPRPPGPFDAAASYAVTLMSLGHFLFWFRWFDPRQRRLPRLALALPILIVGFSMITWGNRGILLSCFLVAAFAFRYARGRLSLTQGTAVVVLAFVALSIGMVYGSLFRRLKGGETGSRWASAVPAVAEPALVASTPEVPPEVSASAATPPEVPAAAAAPPSLPTAVVATPASPAPVAAPPPSVQLSRPSMGRQLEAAVATVATLVHEPRSAGFSAILAGVGQRLNLLSDVSVTIARYSTLRPLEAAHGVADLWTMTWTGFVPRAIWPAKPRVSDTRAYAALYFGWDGNSYAISPPADLIRNGGPLMMPLGMALLGFILGILRTALITGNPLAAGERAALYTMLLLSINLESSYGMLLPTMLRVGFVSLLGLGIVRLWRLTGWSGHRAH